jgi:CheY-like chemotaxis protein
MDGVIDVQSTPDKGSVFSITLNMDKQSLETNDAIRESSNLYISAHSQHMNHPRVLLAEDNQINQEVAQAMLESLGCEVTVVNDGVLALQALKNNHFDLVLMDCQMPGMDGLETTRQVRMQQAEYAHIPIIALTANVQKTIRDECNKAGMNDYLSKPFTQADIREIISRWSPSS